MTLLIWIEQITVVDTWGGKPWQCNRSQHHTKRIVGDRALYLNPWASERKERPMEDWVCKSCYRLSGCASLRRHETADFLGGKHQRTSCLQGNYAPLVYTKQGYRYRLRWRGNCMLLTIQSWNYPGVSIGKSVYIHIELTDYLIWNWPDRWSVFCCLERGWLEVRPQQLHKGVTAALREQSRGQRVGRIMTDTRSDRQWLTVPGLPETKTGKQKL